MNYNVVALVGNLLMNGVFFALAQYPVLQAQGQIADFDFSFGIFITKICELYVFVFISSTAQSSYVQVTVSIVRWHIAIRMIRTGV